MSSLNVAIVGFAHGHVNGYLAAWKEHPEFGVAAVAGWDHDADRLASSCASHNLTPYSSLDDLLSNPAIHGVVIAAETGFHADLVESAAEAGKAICLQKPMALTLAQADRVVAAVEKHGVPFTMAWQMRVDPQNQRMRDIILNEELGKVYSIRRRHGLMAHQNESLLKSWHTNAEMNRDLWADDAAHPLDFMYWIFGMPESLTAEIVTAAGPSMTNDNGIVVLRYPGGPLAEVNCSFTCHAAENTTEIYCEHGVVIQSFGDNPACNAPRIPDQSGLKWYRDGQWIYSHIPTPNGHFERIKGLAEPLAAFLNGQRPPIATAREGRDTLRMVLATYVSSAEGRRIRLDDPRIDLT